MEQRKLEVAVISDLHLATHACKAKSVLKYLKSIAPKILVLNGDIIDSWRFSRSYFPKSHLKLVRYMIKMLEKGIKIYYVSGNHDEFLRKFNLSEIGNLKIVNHLIINLNGEKTLIIHGDVFDSIVNKAKWLAKFGAATYGLLTVINKFINAAIRFFGFREIIIYKSIKKSLLREDRILTRFESAAIAAAKKHGCSTVICGHTHTPKDKIAVSDTKSIRYMNCGDWVENLTSVEYYCSGWELYHYIDSTEEALNDELENIFPEGYMLNWQNI
jgi:UDP-2,3-diacylglucosamine pyrophosphatase LpxH